MSTTTDFSEEQKQYLQGFTAGSGIARTLANLPTFASTLGLAPSNGALAPAAAAAAAAAPASDQPARPEDIHVAAQDRFTAAGKTLVKEEQAKRKRHGLDVWDDIVANAAAGKFPAGTDVFLYKFHGLFFVAPAQESIMCRLRIPGGILTAHQLAGAADVADLYAGGYADITTRANLQLRQIRPADAPRVLTGLQDLGIVTRGAGADNVRNITASPTAGIDPQELIDVRPLVKDLHYHILHHRELYGLPRKFNIAFDGGGAIATLEDTNDIGFAAVRVGEGRAVPAGVYFRMELGGITGHGDFARDAGLLLRPEQCVSVAVAAIRAFIDHGDRTDRKKARLKYVLERLGLAGFLDEMRKHLSFELTTLPPEACEPRPQPVRHAHAGAHPQKQQGLHYVGVVIPASRMRSDQMRGIADIAAEHGSGTIRLTVWQNLLISDVPAAGVETAKRKVEALGLSWSASGIRAGLVACTGNAGCKFALADTKRHALAIADVLEPRMAGALDVPVNVHLTGCPNSCAQHYIGDIGLLGTKVSDGDGDDAAEVEGYHLFVGGGYGPDQGVGRELLRNLKADEVPATVERVLRTYLDHRSDPDESFVDFVRRHPTDELKAMLEPAAAAAP
jgi:ferredoxin-nitrite reductase